LFERVPLPLDERLERLVDQLFVCLFGVVAGPVVDGDVCVGVLPGEFRAHDEADTYGPVAAVVFGSGQNSGGIREVIPVRLDNPGYFLAIDASHVGP